MIDGEVIRLRRLRARALKTRALAMAMYAVDAPRSDTLSRRNSLSRSTALLRSAQNCWRVSKVATGMLRSHPNLSYQEDYSPLRGAVARFSAGCVARLARQRNASAQVFCEELWAVARAVEDARALTWSAELSDTLGRTQLQLRGLLRECEAAAVLETNSLGGLAPSLKSYPAPVRDASPAAAPNSPYLAL